MSKILPELDFWTLTKLFFRARFEFFRKKEVGNKWKIRALAQNTRCNEKPLLILELAKLSATIFDYGALFGGVKVKNKLK